MTDYIYADGVIIKLNSNWVILTHTCSFVGPDGITNWYSQPGQPFGAPVGLMALLASSEDKH
jgi:hypothetical protein